MKDRRGGFLPGWGRAREGPDRASRASTPDLPCLALQTPPALFPFLSSAEETNLGLSFFTF